MGLLSDKFIQNAEQSGMNHNEDQGEAQRTGDESESGLIPEVRLWFGVFALIVNVRESLWDFFPCIVHIQHGADRREQIFCDQRTDNDEVIGLFHNVGSKISDRR